MFRYVHWPSPRPHMRVFRQKSHRVPLNMLSISAATFELEKKLRQGPISTASFPNISAALTRRQTTLVGQSINELLELILVESVQVGFRKEALEPTRTASPAPAHADAIVLFSGGTDSLAGILASQRRYEKILGVACAHADQSKGIRLQTRFGTLLKKRFDIALQKVNVPAIGKGTFAQTRGFLYILAAGAWAGVTGASRLVVSECGPTMYQPRFGPFDQVTMTSHPYVLSIAQRVVSDLVDRNVAIITPFEDMTKAEVLATCRVKDLLPQTHSCISQRFLQHDGTCYGCVMRRLASIAADTRDTQYRKDPLKDRDARQENLVSILRYSLQFLDRGHRMSLYQIENIEMFSKHDLFERFALDNLAAVYKLEQSGKRLTAFVKGIVDAARRTVGDRTLERRLRVLSSGQRRPSFTPKQLFHRTT